MGAQDARRLAGGEARRVATALWLPSAALVLALDERLGAPVDSYVNGSQTWLTPDGPKANPKTSGSDEKIVLEWRLHPVANYTAPRGLSHYDVWETVISALSRDADTAVIGLGEEHRRIDQLWGGLECYAAYGDDIEPGILAATTAEVLGIAPDRFGLVDHQAIGDAW